MNLVEEWWRKQAPAMRLTIAYVSILAFICLIFSLSLYRLSVGQLETGLRHQYMRLQPFAGGAIISGPTPAQIEDELESGKRRLAAELIYFNLVIILLGTGASYALAKRTLRPIEEALEAQSRFTADASHELRTPLTAMQTEIEVALRNPKLSKDEAQALLGSNLEEVAKLRALAVGLLRLANGNGKDLPRSPVSLKDVAGEAVSRVAKAAKQNKNPIADNTKDIAVMGDKESLAEIITILLDNAIKYSQPGKPITVSTSRHGRQAHISVTDEGIGIKSEDLGKIFDRFYRADSSRTKEGYGLGLSIAQKLAGLHNGTIDAKSSEGKGSAFILKLPVA